jgi:branched-chain amino acid aminotransferase
MNGEWIWCDGEFLEAGCFTLSPRDRGLMIGLGVFETMLALDGKPAFFQKHISRLERGCLVVAPGFRESIRESGAAIRQAADELLQRNGHGGGRARVRLSLTAGEGAPDRTDAISPGRMWIMTAKAPEPPDSLTVAVCPWTRNPGSALAGIKSASWAENAVALDWARGRGADEPLFLTPDGRVCEAATSNIFLVRDGGIATPSLQAGCLPGIGRSVILDLCAEQGITCEECDITMADLHAADGIFLTSALRGVVPVRSLDGSPVPLHPLATRLREEVRKAAISSIP